MLINCLGDHVENEKRGCAGKGKEKYVKCMIQIPNEQARPLKRRKWLGKGDL
jgi:hypothetical protein